ncbi:hypothetical protein HGRIS_001519 [Hohenbuehelia grisea]|uniref:Uncharacterized protein n=1 Tax=Hohenbuehelia grisea TaxID=104357 RepID=A0ABR3JQC0_9AGAR
MNSSHPQEEWALDSAVGLVHKEVSGEQDSLQRYARAEEEMKKRRQKAGRRRRWDLEQGITITVDKKRRGSKKGGKAPKEESYTDGDAATAAYPFWTLMRAVYHTVPHQPIVALGLFICLCSGAIMPVFSFLLSCLLFEASTDADNVRVINYFGGLVLGTRHSTSCSSASSTSSWKAPRWRGSCASVRTPSCACPRRTAASSTAWPTPRRFSSPMATTRGT